MSCIELAAGCLSTLILTTSWFFATQNCWLWFISQWFEYFDWAFDPERVVLSDSIRPRVGNIVFVDWLCVSRKLLFPWTDLALGHYFDPTCLLRACQIESAHLSVLAALVSYPTAFLLPPPDTWLSWQERNGHHRLSDHNPDNHFRVVALTKLQYSSYLTKPGHYISASL